jgi:hypothetical protein
MNKLNPLVTVGIILIIISGSQAQNLQLTNGNQTKTFKTGTLIKVDIPPREGLGCDPCKNNYLIGRIISYKNDTLTLRIRFEREPIMAADKVIGSQVRDFKEKNEKDWPIIDIPKKNIYSVTKQGKKEWRPVNAGDGLGVAYFSTGLIFLLTSLVAEGENNQSSLSGTGVTLTVIGLIMITFFERETYHIENGQNNKPNVKTWNIR